MIYTKRTWINGETLDADKMNNLEQGVYDNSLTADIAANGSAVIDLSAFYKYNFAISSTNTVLKQQSQCVQIEVNPYWKDLVLAAGSNATAITLLNSRIPSTISGGASISSYLASGETGRRQVSANETLTVDVTGAEYVCIHTRGTQGTDITPSVTAYSKIGSAVRQLTT